MKHIIISLLFMSLIGCAPSSAQTPKEKTLLQMLARAEIALGYERHCLKEPKPINANLYGNLQYIIYTLAEEISKHASPDATDKQKMAYVEAKLNPHTKKIRENIDKIFVEKGCVSKEALQAKKAHEVLTKLHPAQLAPLLNTTQETPGDKPIAKSQ